ncbi:hypothetical protein GCM10011390_36710 [Aureimonas endophytica]|uniref:DUF721 domain-containing protein n=1 Tax=Aureimonas endophytica TaxID=2027858 RepID=A0A916ZU47_9HYPH|nr:DciA family protein [Aureimonas endophytica]GGE14209.1 hypothetical protein GCM10011390_36710 [Aureimonas endophytica]
MNRRPRPPAPVGETAQALLDPVLRKKAGMTIGLIGAWPEIVGQRLEGVTRPEKLVWPPGAGSNDAFRPATLVVACEGASALRLQHEADEIVQRVNAFLGHHAVDRLRIVQKAVAAPPRDAKPKLRALGESEARRIETLVERIEDPKLRQALADYAASMLARLPPKT